MKTTILALAAVATLGMAVPAFAQGAQGGAPRGTAIKVSSQDFSSSHRHHWRHNGAGAGTIADRHCNTLLASRPPVTVCR